MYNGGLRRAQHSSDRFMSFKPPCVSPSRRRLLQARICRIFTRLDDTKISDVDKKEKLGRLTEIFSFPPLFMPSSAQICVFFNNCYVWQKSSTDQPRVLRLFDVRNDVIMTYVSLYVRVWYNCIFGCRKTFSSIFALTMTKYDRKHVKRLKMCCGFFLLHGVCSAQKLSPLFCML